MKYQYKIASSMMAAAAGICMMASCEGGDLYNVDSPDWISARVDSIKQANAANAGGDDEIEGLTEDVYTVGAADFSTGWWAQFSKYYQVPDGEKWVAQFNLSINPAATNTYKNYAMIICNDEDRGAANYKEYGAIRFDNQPSGNSEWGDYIDRSCVESNLTFNTDTDEGVGKLGGKVTLTVDRTDPAAFTVIMTNGTVTKTYKQKTALANLNADESNTKIRCFLVPEGSCINWLGSTIEPIGGFTDAMDKLPLSMVLNGVPKKVLVGTDPEVAFANITATVTFEQEVSKDLKMGEFTLQVVPDLNSVGKATLVAAYAKSFKGEGAEPVIATAVVEVVDKMYTCVGATDNSSAWWTAFSDNIHILPGETFVSKFTSYTSGANNWNNFCVVLNGADVSKEYAVVRADNYGWGNGYDACSHEGTQGDWATWLAAMDGAKVTTYITNKGDGTVDVKEVFVGNDGNTYTQNYIGINNIDPEDLYFRFVMDNCHIEFDEVIGADDNSTPWWTAFSENLKVPAGETYTVRFTNYTSGANNWNNFVVILDSEDTTTEYAVVRADNYGWGSGYDACAHEGTQGDWATWLAAMEGAKVTVAVQNLGDGTANIYCEMIGNDGNIYTQNYLGINTIDPDNFYFRFTVDGSHFVFE